MGFYEEQRQTGASHRPSSSDDLSETSKRPEKSSLPGYLFQGL